MKRQTFADLIYIAVMLVLITIALVVTFAPTIAFLKYIFS